MKSLLNYEVIPTLKLSVLFGDEDAIGQMEKLVMNRDAGTEVRRQTMKILIDSNSRNLKSISEKLLKISRNENLGSPWFVKI